MKTLSLIDTTQLDNVIAALGAAGVDMGPFGGITATAVEAGGWLLRLPDEISLDGIDLEDGSIRLAALKETLKAQIDAAAEVERLKYITPGAGQTMTYQRKLEQAKQADADTDPDPADYPMLAASIGIDGATIADVASTVIAMDAAWETVGAGIEAARLGAKKAVGDAEDTEAARAVLSGIVWPAPT
jgi:hypothetical protein